MTKSNTKQKPMTTTTDDKAEKLADRRAKILERAGVRARRDAALVLKESSDEGGGGSRFYDPDDYGATASNIESVEADVGWLPLDGRPR